MNFELNEDTKSILETTRRFVKRDVLPRIKEEGFKRDIVTKMGEMGLFGCAFPYRYGGSDVGFLAHSVVCEEVSRGDSGLRSLFNMQAMTVPYTIMEWGTAAARSKYVRALVTAEKLGCACFSEPNAGSDIAAIETKITDAGSHFLLNGQKTWISNGTVADYAVVYCT